MIKGLRFRFWFPVRHKSLLSFGRNKFAWFFVILTIVVLALLAVSYFVVERSASGYVYHSTDDVPRNSVGLVLWTSSKLPDGSVNAFFAYRIAAAAKLFAKKRVNCLLVSGDNSTVTYNEIKDMQVALMEKGVPPERIIGDFAGFRTLDSVIRAKEIFGLSRFTVISQASHAERAVFIARLSDIDAIAYEATSPPFWDSIIATLREIPARTLAVYDAVFSQTRPKFLGDPIRIETDPSVRPVPDKICFPR